MLTYLNSCEIMNKKGGLMFESRLLVTITKALKDGTTFEEQHSFKSHAQLQFYLEKSKQHATEYTILAYAINPSSL